MQNLGVIVDGLVETTVVPLYHIVHKLLYGFLLAFQLHEVVNQYLLVSAEVQEDHLSGTWSLAVNICASISTERHIWLGQSCRRLGKGQRKAITSQFKDNLPPQGQLLHRQRSRYPAHASENQILDP